MDVTDYCPTCERHVKAKIENDGIVVITVCKECGMTIRVSYKEDE
jgi:RNase P subunit RPR2